MAKMTLIAMVQNILSAMDSDEVNSISDTTESIQVAEVIKETFYEVFNGLDLPETQKLFQLTSVSDVASPNYLKIPSNVGKLLWVKYKNFAIDRFEELEYWTPEDFLEAQLLLPSDGTTTVTTDPSSGVQYSVKTNKAPQRFTIFDDTYLACDSFDSSNESVLQSSNSIAFGYEESEFLLEDDYIPPLDSNLFPLLLAEAKSVCFNNFKQIANPKEEQKARRQRIRMQRDKFKSKQAYEGFFGRNDYSRKR